MLTESQMVKYIYKKCVQKGWLVESFDEKDSISSSDTAELGVILRRPGGIYACEPSYVSPQLWKAAERLGAQVAFTMSSDVTQGFFEQITPLQTEAPLDPFGMVLPIATSIDDIVTGKSSVSQDAYMCACRRERFVLIWGVSAQSIVAHGSEVETRLMGLVRTCINVQEYLGLLTAHSGLGQSSGNRRRNTSLSYAVGNLARRGHDRPKHT
jgi:hypothetical protein